jgi:hypothetical protein
MPKSVDLAKADLATLVPHLRVAARDALKRANAGATVEFAVIAKNPDGSGQIGASFQCEEFLSDLETVFPPSESDVKSAEADCLLSKVSRGMV